nr:RNA-directed DNA polymerase, eukaryota, reverse transcriptase zinc-binding domain protein [Tanacetum cinerariifolium]
SNSDDHFKGPVFNVNYKFYGRKKVLLDDFKAFDCIRHLHLLAGGAVDLKIGVIVTDSEEYLNIWDSLWARSIKAIHGSLFQSGFQVKKGHNSCWTNIIKEVESLSKQGIHVLNYLRIKLGDGKSSKFWCDSWSDEGVLKDMFPRVYALESCKNITIADKVRQENPYQLLEELQEEVLSKSSFNM